MADFEAAAMDGAVKLPVDILHGAVDPVLDLLHAGSSAVRGVGAAVKYVGTSVGLRRGDVMAAGVGAAVAVKSNPKIVPSVKHAVGSLFQTGRNVGRSTGHGGVVTPSPGTPHPPTVVPGPSVPKVYPSPTHSPKLRLHHGHGVLNSLGNVIHSGLGHMAMVEHRVLPAATLVGVAAGGAFAYRKWHGKEASGKAGPDHGQPTPSQPNGNAAGAAASYDKAQRGAENAAERAHKSAQRAETYVVQHAMDRPRGGFRGARVAMVQRWAERQEARASRLRGVAARAASARNRASGRSGGLQRGLGKDGDGGSS